MNVKNFRPRTREEEREAMVMWGLAGMIGVISLVGFGYCGYQMFKSCAGKDIGDLEEGKAGLITTTFKDDKPRCKLGNNIVF